MPKLARWLFGVASFISLTGAMVLAITPHLVEEMRLWAYSPVVLFVFGILFGFVAGAKYDFDNRPSGSTRVPYITWAKGGTDVPHM
ncbi:MAG: hypothetical protein K2Q06_04655 [Parvularculaceae bacterium]|nr:hypothetical protein [Parvularculaceae bacterium]